MGGLSCCANATLGLSKPIQKTKTSGMIKLPLRLDDYLKRYGCLLFGIARFVRVSALGFPPPAAHAKRPLFADFTAESKSPTSA